jgi:hypothetical protein
MPGVELRVQGPAIRLPSILAITARAEQHAELYPTARAEQHAELYPT